MTPAIMHQHALFHDSDIHANLGELILGIKPRRETETERIHYAHTRMDVDDVVLAWAVYLTARERRLGITLPLRESLWV